MFSVLLIVLTLGALLAFARLGWWWGGRYESHFTVAQSALGVAAIAGAAAWYFVARPDAAKLKFEQTITPVTMPDRRTALLLAEVSLNNVGAQTLRLDDVPARLYVQQITPPSRGVLDEFQAENYLGHERKIRPADTWNYLAKLSTHIDSEIESEETENFYYRVIVPCEPSLRVYWTIWVEKPRSIIDRLVGADTVWWIKQSYVDLTAVCSAPTESPTSVAGSARTAGRKGAPANRAVKAPV